MKFSTVLAALACAEAAIAGPVAEKRRNARQSRRGNGTVRKSQPKLTTSHVDYSQNWAGVAIVSTDVTSVTGTVVVPDIAGSSSRTESAGSAWVGIDGDTCQTSILQTGFDWIVDGDDITFDAWYEWYPADSVDFTGIAIAVGDSIKMTVTATSTTGGTAVIENLTTGVTVSKTFSGETDALCRTNAEWIVEDFEECGSTCELVPFADFGTVEFTDAVATINGATVEASTGTIIDIEQTTVLTSCSASGETVTCTYL
ncbi:acid proteinase [Xylariales sp. PMI_506]|nr:acid proteinase [Xylariales sp. PMI_506]